MLSLRVAIPLLMCISCVFMKSSLYEDDPVQDTEHPAVTFVVNENFRQDVIEPVEFRKRFERDVVLPSQVCKAEKQMDLHLEIVGLMFSFISCAYSAWHLRTKMLASSMENKTQLQPTTEHPLS